MAERQVAVEREREARFDLGARQPLGPQQRHREDRVRTRVIRIDRECAAQQIDRATPVDHLHAQIRLLEQCLDLTIVAHHAPPETMITHSGSSTRLMTKSRSR